MNPRVLVGILAVPSLWFEVRGPNAFEKTKGALHERRTNSKSTRPSKAVEQRRSPRRWRVGYGAPKIRQVLECAAVAALWISLEVHGPNARTQGGGGSP